MQKKNTFKLAKYCTSDDRLTEMLFNCTGSKLL